MTKIKLLSIGVIGLLLLNLALVVYLFLNNDLRKPEDRRQQGEGPKLMIIDKLNFDSKQVEQYEKLIQIHRAAIRKLDEQIMAAKKDLYSTLSNNLNVSNDSLKQRIAFLHEEIEEIHFDHFLQIKKLCKPQQAQLFDALAKELAELFAPPGKQHNHDN